MNFLNKSNEKVVKSELDLRILRGKTYECRYYG